MREFAHGTKIHGFNFLVSPKSSPRTKIIWAISIFVALSYASWEMRNSAISKYHYTLPTPWLTQVWFTQISPTWLFKRFPFLIQQTLINSVKWKYEIKLILTWLTLFFHSTKSSVNQWVGVCLESWNRNKDYYQTLCRNAFVEIWITFSEHSLNLNQWQIFLDHEIHSRSSAI